MLDDGARGDVPRRGRGGRPGELGPLDRHAGHRPDELPPDHDHEAQDDGVAIATPRGRVDEDRRADDVADDAVDDLDWMLGRAELEDPRLRAIRPGQLNRLAVQPDDEDLGLDGAVDVPARGCATHVVILAMPR